MQISHDMWWWCWKRPSQWANHMHRLCQKTHSFNEQLWNVCIATATNSAAWSWFLHYLASMMEKSARASEKYLHKYEIIEINYAPHGKGDRKRWKNLLCPHNVYNVNGTEPQRWCWSDSSPHGSSGWRKSDYVRNLVSCLLLTPFILVRAYIWQETRPACLPAYKSANDANDWVPAYVISNNNFWRVSYLIACVMLEVHTKALNRCVNKSSTSPRLSPLSLFLCFMLQFYLTQSSLFYYYLQPVVIIIDGHNFAILVSSVSLQHKNYAYGDMWSED